MANTAGTSGVENLGLRLYPMRMVLKQVPLPWLLLPAICVVYAASVWSLHPANLFGIMHDDSIYFSSARAIAAGHGYVLPSVPGTPPATKYPILYPYILSSIWRLNPSFPGNLSAAIVLDIAIGCLLVVATFLFLQDLKEFSEAETLLLTVFCALHANTVFFTAAVISEVPFAAVGLILITAADTAMNPSRRGWQAMLCGLLAAVSVLLRMFGLAIVAGVLATAIARRAWRQMAIFGATVAPVLGWVIAWSLLSLRSASKATSIRSLLGWKMTWIYYTSYSLHWKLSTPSAHVLYLMLRNNVLAAFKGLSDYFLFPLLNHDNVGIRVIVVVVGAMTIMGIARLSRGRPCKTFHFVLPFYAVLVLFWNYPYVDRFFFPFLPLLSAGLWVEGKYILSLVRNSFSRDKLISEKLIASSLGVLLGTLALGILWNYAFGLRVPIAERSEEREHLLREQREAYDWISHRSSNEVRVIAYEDALFYLYTGRQAMRPIALSTAEFYEPARLDGILDHMTDVARTIRAAYWIVCDDDFYGDWSDATEKERIRVRDLVNNFPVVFRSKSGHVRIYDLSCMQEPELTSCAMTTNPPRREGVSQSLHAQ